MQNIDLSNRVQVCAECGAVVNQCACGSKRHPITMSRMMYEIIQTQEDLNTPIKEVHLTGYKKRTGDKECRHRIRTKSRVWNV